MKKNILMIAVTFAFLTIFAAGCASTGKYPRTYISPDDPVYDIPTIPAAPPHVVAAVLAANRGEVVAPAKNKAEQTNARPNNKDYQEFIKRMKKIKAEQKAKAIAAKTPETVPMKKREAFSKKSFETRLSKVERRVNYVIGYSRENRNRIGLLDDRFNLSACGKIQAKLILFKSGSAELSPKGKKVFDELAEKAGSDQIGNIVITGHASTTGGKISNKTLSEKRAKTAYDYLTTKGITAKMIPAGETSRYGNNTNISVTWLEK